LNKRILVRVKNASGATMASYDHIQQELRVQLGRATARGAIDMLITAGELFDSVPYGARPDLGMGYCCDAMRDEIGPGDILLVERSNGPGMTVRFMLPRRSAIAMKTAN
jgi:hypothetical protein